MNSFMQLLLLLLVFGHAACTVRVRTVRNVFNTDAAGGGDQRRRKPWQEWTYDGPPHFQPEEWPDDDDPASWLKFAKKILFVGARRIDLRRPCFYKGSLCT